MELATQKAQIEEVQPSDREKLLSSSNSVFLISKLWWDKWCNHVGYYIERNDPSPGPIYNHSLLTGSGHTWRTLRLRQDLQEGQDFVMLSSTAWRRLFKWYGGGPEIHIFLIGQEPELNPIMLEIWILDSLTAPIPQPGKTILLSAELTIKDSQFHISQKLGVPYYKYDLKPLDGAPGEFESFLNDSLTLKNAGVVYGSKVALIPKEQNVAIALPAFPELDEETQVRLNNSDEEDMGLAMAIQASLTERADEDAPTSGTESTGPSSCLICELRDEQNPEIELPNATHPTYEDVQLRFDKDEIQNKIIEVMSGPRIKLGFRTLESIDREMFRLWGEYQEWRKKAASLDKPLGTV